MFETLRRRVSAHGPWPRRLLALACLALAAMSALPRSSTAGGTVAVVVAGRALPAGHPLDTRDVRVRRFPATLVPSGSLRSVAELAGKRLAGPVATGEPLTGRRLVGRGLTADLAPDVVALSVPVDDANVDDFVHAGDQVDLVAAADPDAAVDPGRGTDQPGHVAGGALAQAVRVLAVLAPDAAQTSAVTDVGSSGSTAELVIAADRPTALVVARAKALGPFTVFLSGT